MRANPGLPTFILCVFLVVGYSATAQSAGLDEAVGPDGAMAPTVSLTAAQRAAIYTAVMRQRVRSPGGAIAPIVGASVPPSATLRDIPVGVGTAEQAGDLKYAMVADDVVVVDPIRMRVVDVIHSGGRP